MLPGKKLNPSDFLQIASRRAWIIAIPPVVMLFAALLYSSTVPNLYQSDMLIAIDPQRVPESYVRSTVTLSTDLRLDAISVQVLSRTNLERMIGTLDLYPEERRRLPMEDVIAQMRQNIDVGLERPRPGTAPTGGPNQPHAFHVRFTYSDPQVAARVTQQLGSLYVDQNAKDRHALAQSTNQFLVTQLGEAREKLETQERRLEAFRQLHGKALPTQMQTNLQVIMSTQMQVQALVESIARDRDRKLMLERLYSDALTAPAVAETTGVPTANGNAAAVPVNASARQQLAAARATLAALRRRLTDEHPDIVRTNRLIAELEPKAEAEERSAAATPTAGASYPANTADIARRDRLTQMAAEIESLARQTAFKDSEERRLRSEVAEYQRRIEAVPGLESEWVALTRDYDTQQTVYKELLTKSGNAQLSVDLENQQIGEHFRVVDSAGVPVHPLPSLRMRINLAGFALGLFLGVGIAAFLELQSAVFRSSADVLDVLAFPVLANVPRIHTAAEKTLHRRRAVMLSLVGLGCVAGAGYVTWTLKLWNSII